MADTIDITMFHRALWYDFLIDGNPILVPDEEIQISKEDLDGEDSGRDESGYMHRIRLREGVRSIPLSYWSVNHAEYKYMESLFSGKPEFTVRYKDPDGNEQTFTAYRSKHSITLRNHRTGDYRNYSFNVIEC